MRRPRNLGNSVFSFLLVIAVIFGIATYPTPETAPAITKDWTYYSEFAPKADKYKIIYTESTDFYGNIDEVSPRIYSTYEEVKNRLRSELQEYGNLCWERFERTGIKQCDFTRDFFASDCTMAFYMEKDDSLYCVRDQFDKLIKSNDWSHIHEIIAHELVHALTVTDANRQSVVCEGFTEFIAQSIYPTDFPSYFYHYAFIENLVKDIGPEAAIQAFLDGTVEEKVDTRIGKPGAMKGIEPLLEHAGAGVSSDYEELIIIDVYTHYLQATRTADVLMSSKYPMMTALLSDTPKNKAACDYFNAVLLSSPPTNATVN